MGNSERPNDDIDILKHVTSDCRPSRKKDENDGSKIADIIDDRWPKRVPFALRAYSLRSFGRDVGLDSKRKPGSAVLSSTECFI